MSTPDTILFVRIMKRAIPIVSAVSALLVGGLIYVIWRPESLVMFRWFDALSLEGVVATLRAYGASHSRTFPEWVYFSLPQGLWIMSGIVLLGCVWANNSRAALAWPLGFALFGFSLEGAQYAGWLPGRFDQLDLLFLVIASCLAGSVLYFCHPRMGEV
jgi:hypothetical protein